MNRAPFHPFLIACAPVLVLFAHNARRIALVPGELVPPLALALALALAALLVFRILLRDSSRAGIAAALLVLIVFSWGHAAGALRGFGWYRDWQLGAFGAAVIAVATILLRRGHRPLRTATAVLNIVALAVFGLGLVRVLAASGRAAPGGRERTTVAHPAPGAPDIYHIVPDGHARSDILADLYGHDNSGFVDSLRALGFFVADSARANYSQTYLSLGSALNLDYADSIARWTGLESDDRGPLIHWLQDNRLMGELRARGYRVISFASGYSGTEFRNADEHLVPPGALSEFQNLLLALTPFGLLLRVLPAPSQHDLHRRRLDYILDRLPTARGAGGPAYVFAHLLAPHPPFVYGPRGEPREVAGPWHISDGNHYHHGEPGAVAAYVAGYRDQVRHIEDRLLGTVTEIIRRSPRPPVIILHADHGPGSRLNHDDPRWTWFPERQSIFLAVLMPERDHAGLHHAITPVNVFRRLLNRLGPDTLAPLPDRSFFATWNRPYEHYDVDEWQPPERRIPPRVGVVAFRQAAVQPAEPGSYYRRLVHRRLPGAQVGPVLLYLVDTLPDVNDAYARYRAAVGAGAVPDLGTEYEHFRGPHGADWRPVLALLFPLGREGN